jgi:hypothetical protein
MPRASSSGHRFSWRPTLVSATKTSPTAPPSADRRCTGPSAAFVEGSQQAALGEEPRPGAERKLSGKEEALQVATACSNPPEGRTRWTLELLAEGMVTLTEHEDLSREAVRRRPSLQPVRV